MKLVFMGTPDFSVGALEALQRAGHTVTAVVTQPDKPKGRGKEVKCSPVKECAVRDGLPVFQPVRIRTPEAVEELRSYEADVFIVAAFGQILTKEILEMPRLGCLNIHASLLPKYRGASPIQQAVIDGEEKTGITIMQMDEGIDTGDILYQKELPIDGKETGASLFEKLSVLGAQAIVEALDLLGAGKLIPRRQEEALASHVGMMKKTAGLIRWEESAVSIERLVRGLNSWPSAYTFWQGKQLKIWEADVEPQADTDRTDAGPGSVAQITRDALRILTGDGIVEIKELQLEGKKRMTTHDFLLGVRIKTGELLG